MNVPGPEIEPVTLVYENDTLTNWATWPGLLTYVLKATDIHMHIYRSSYNILMTDIFLKIISSYFSITIYFPYIPLPHNHHTVDKLYFNNHILVLVYWP